MWAEYEREIDWVSVTTCFWHSIHSSAKSPVQHKTLVLMSAQESDFFVILFFHLLRWISDDSAAQCICCLPLQVFVESKNNFLVYNPVSVSFSIKVFTADTLIKTVSCM